MLGCERQAWFYNQAARGVLKLWVEGLVRNIVRRFPACMCQRVGVGVERLASGASSSGQNESITGLRLDFRDRGIFAGLHLITYWCASQNESRVRIMMQMIMCGLVDWFVARRRQGMQRPPIQSILIFGFVFQVRNSACKHVEVDLLPSHQEIHSRVVRIPNTTDSPKLQCAWRMIAR